MARIIRRIRHVVYDIAGGITWACWGVLALVWLVGATLSRHRVPEVRARSGHDLPSLLGLVVGLAAALSPASLWQSVTVASSWMRIAGIAVVLPAAAATIWARITLGSIWSSAVVAKEGHQLRTDGPYRITRHPIYSGILAMLAGTALTQGLGRWVALLAAVAVVLVAKLTAEERLLSREFPHDYERYRRRVPALLPRLLPRGH